MLSQYHQATRDLVIWQLMKPFAGLGQRLFRFLVVAIQQVPLGERGDFN